MADYKESSISGSKYTRAGRINIDNPVGGIPNAVFFEEEVLSLGDSTFTQPTSSVSISLSDPTKEIPLRDISTWELTGQTTTVGVIYQAIASVYWMIALERDQKNSI